MKSAPPHAPRVLSRVLAAPWPGVHVTDIASDRRFARHYHASFGVGVVEDGAHHSASGRGPVRAYAGDVITTNPGEVHDGRPLGGPTRRWRIVSLDVAAMASFAARGGAHVEIARPVIEDARLARALRRLFRRIERWNAARGAREADALACEASLAEACTLLLTRHGAAPAGVREAGADVRRARERLADDALAPPTLAELAAVAGVSRWQLLRRFERAYGLPPHAWLLQRRAERARALIRAGAALPAAAAASGFADQSHMTRVFARHFGYTPGAWKRAAAPSRSQ